jgi:hypothetical protein
MGSVLRPLAATLALGLLALAPPAGAQQPQSFEAQTAALDKIVTKVNARIKEVEELRKVAVREGAALKLSCINEKLKKLRETRDNLRLIREGWQLGKTNRQFADRSLDRANILQLLANTTADEAYLCVDTRALATTTVTVETDMPDVPPAEPEIPRPTVLERPPLASPY